jgi:two-component system sensor histidine kinase HydH
MKAPTDVLALHARARTEAHYRESVEANHTLTSRVFFRLMIAQWVLGVIISLTVSPFSWEGTTRSLHVHVLTAIFLGGAISALPMFLAWRQPSATVTRHVIAAAQMMWSALLIHLTGGRIETHFHVFGSLAFISFYRDWRVLGTATLMVSADHLVRGLLWPESVYGIENPEWWRFLEHATWVVFENVVLVLACQRGLDELRKMAERQALAEVLSESDRLKSEELGKALADVNRSHEALTRAEKLAAVGQLAASVGHELRNPLGAVRNALAYLQKRVLAPDATPQSLREDKRVPQFVAIMEQELNACSRIISDLLDFARERKPERRPCPLRPLVEDVFALVPPRPNVKLVNDVPGEIPVPELDKDQFRQVLINLVQNASEAVSPEREGEVRVEAEGGGDQPWIIRVRDNGLGIPPETLPKIFEPLFTTKTKGTGLGLAIVAGLVRGHQGTIDVTSAVGSGTTFVIQLSVPALNRAA